MVREIFFLQVQNSLTHPSENPIAIELLIEISEEKNFNQCRIVGIKIHKLLCFYSFSLNYSNLSINFTVYEKKTQRVIFFFDLQKIS